jgi:ATP-binding cassette subfamily B protein
MGLTRLRAAYLPFFDFLPTIGFVGTLWYGSTLVEQGAITVGALVQANAYILLLSNPLRTVGTTIAQLQRALVSATLIGEIVSVEPAITDPPHPVPLGAVRGEIRFENIALRYEGSPVLALDGRSRRTLSTPPRRPRWPRWSMTPSPPWAGSTSS